MRDQEVSISCDKCEDKIHFGKLVIVQVADMGNVTQEEWCLPCFKRELTDLPDQP